MAQANKLKSWVAMSDSMAEKYKTAPPPVDFAAAKKGVRDTELVDKLQAFYAASKPAPETHAMPEEERVQSQENLAYLKELDAVHKEFVPVLEEEINFVTANRTTKDTTLFDMKMNYPLIHEEIEDELERREWFKDTGYGSSSK